MPNDTDDMSFIIQCFHMNAQFFTKQIASAEIEWNLNNSFIQRSFTFSLSINMEKLVKSCEYF